MLPSIEQRILARKEGKRIPLAVKWRGKVLNFGGIGFKGDNSFVIGLSVPSWSETIDMGEARVENDQILYKPTDITQPLNKGFHLTLHPPKPPRHKKGILRVGDVANNFQGIPCNWFPIKEEHRLCFYTTPPLGECGTRMKNSPILTEVPAGFENSLLLTFDLFPGNTDPLPPHPKSIGNYWGYSPDYRIRVGIIPLSQKLGSIFYWPQDIDA